MVSSADFESTKRGSRTMANEEQIMEHLQAIAELAEVETSEHQLATVAPQVVMLLQRFPASKGGEPLGETEPAFGLLMRKG